MISWIIKIFALLSVVALAIGLAAEFTSLLGDVRSLSSKPSSTADKPMGIMLAKTSKPKSSKKPLVCEAYKWGTDFPQRPGAIFHGALYHVLTVALMLAMLAHHTLRGISPGMLPLLFNFVPSLQGGWGLSGSGAVMIYLSLQIMSYSIGKLHVIAAVTLFLVGCLNLCGGFVAPIASAAALDPYADPYGGPPPPLDGGYPDERGGAGAPMDGDGAPDPYDGRDPGGLGAGMDDGEGVGASAPPPGLLEKGDDVKTFGGIPAGVPPPVGYAPGNAETNPAMLYPGSTGGASGGDITFDPSTGMWTTVPGSSPAANIQQPGAAMIAPSMPMMPMGYDMFGRPIMAPNPMAAPAVMPGMYNPGWPGVVPPQPALMGDNGSTHSKNSSKKAAKREARKEYRKLRQEEEEEEERERRKEAKRRQKEYEKQVRREEKRQQNAARAVAMQDAQHRTVQELAVEDARQRKHQNVLDERRQEAMAEAKRQAYERDREYQREEEAARRQQEAIREREREELMLARERAEQDAIDMERLDQRKGNQNQALAAAQQAAGMGAPLPAPVNQISYPSQSGCVPPNLRNLDRGMQLIKTDPRSQRVVPQPLAFPGQRTLAPSTVQARNRTPSPVQARNRTPSPTAPGYSPYAYQRSKTGTHLQPPPAQHYRPEVYGNDEYDDDDAMTEIRSVRSETSSQRRLVQRRIEEERERVLQTQERERAMETSGQDVYGEEGSGYGNVLDDYRSARSGGSSLRRHRALW